MLLMSVLPILAKAATVRSICRAKVKRLVIPPSQSGWPEPIITRSSEVLSCLYRVRILVTDIADHGTGTGSIGHTPRRGLSLRACSARCRSSADRKWNRWVTHEPVVGNVAGNAVGQFGDLAAVDHMKFRSVVQPEIIACFRNNASFHGAQLWNLRSRSLLPSCPRVQSRY